MTALCDAGLRIEFLHEHPCTAYPALPEMHKDEDGLWWREKNDLPLTVFHPGAEGRRLTMPAMNYARIADKYDLYARTTFDIPFWLNETRHASGEVLELMAGTGVSRSHSLKPASISPAWITRLKMLAILQRKMTAKGMTARCIQQDVRELTLPHRYNLIIIPFHSFAELLTVEDQQRALAGIYAHLAPQGRFICTLHNPPVRMRQEDGRFRLFGQYPIERTNGTLLLWRLSQYTPGNPLVTGVQLYEEYDANGILREKSYVDVQFRLIARDEFEMMATAAGFSVQNLYGDYSYAPFDAETSPFMIWELRK